MTNLNNNKFLKVRYSDRERMYSEYFPNSLVLVWIHVNSDYFCTKEERLFHQTECCKDLVSMQDILLLGVTPLKRINLLLGFLFQVEIAKDMPTEDPFGLVNLATTFQVHHFGTPQ